jgi:NAD dependent epimerase/dehydratase family enzyme
MIMFYCVKHHEFNRLLAPQNDFASKLCYAWEQTAQEVTQYRIGLAILRFGVVLSTSGGALPRLLLPIRLFMGGRIGSGQQIFSWIHIEDLLRIINWVIANNKTGIYTHLWTCKNKNPYAPTLAGELKKSGVTTS